MLHLSRRSASVRLVITALTLASAATWFSLRSHSQVEAGQHRLQSLNELSSFDDLSTGCPLTFD